MLSPPHLIISTHSLLYLDLENSPGVKFIHTKANATLLDVLSPVDVPSIVHSFFDLSNANSHDGHTLPLLSIQVTELADGVFIGGSVNHMVTDGTSFWHFMATWSEIFRSKDQYHGSISRPPVFDRTNPDYPIINLPYTHHGQFISRFEPPPFQERFFHFSSASVSKLKAKANSEWNMNKISSLQAIIALLWRCVTRARSSVNDTKTSVGLSVSNRRRLSPPLSGYYFGCPIQTVRESATVGDLMGNGFGWAALRLHEAIVNHDDKAIKERAESWIKSPVIIKPSQMIDKNAIHVGSSPKFDMYGCEFGFGKAVAARSGCTNKWDGMITLYPGREGGGSMDVEVCLFSESMMKIERDEELLSALTIN